MDAEKPVSKCSACDGEGYFYGDEAVDKAEAWDAIAAKNAEIARLTAELAASQAQVAAAFDAAASLGVQYGPCKFPPAPNWPDAIRTLTPADAKAALARQLAMARAEGLRMAAKMYEDGGGPGIGGWDYFADFVDAILSRAKDMEAGND